MTPLPAPAIDRRWTAFGWIIAAGLMAVECWKLAFLESAGPAPLQADAAGYWALGAQVARGDFWMLEEPIGYRTPAYPWFLGLCQSLFGPHAWRAVSIAQYVAVGVTTALTGWWAYLLMGRLWALNAALLVRCVSLASASYASTVLTEPLFQPVLVALMILLTTAPNGSWRRWVGIGVLLSIGVAWRPAMVAALPAVMLGAILQLPATPPLRQRLGQLCRNLAIVFGVGLVIVGPWCVRNGMVFGQPKPVIFLGRELWISVLGPGRPAAPALPDTPEAHALQDLADASGEEVDWHNNWSVSRALTAAGRSDAEADHIMQVVALQAVRHDPLRALSRTVWKCADFWRAVYDRPQALYGDNVTAETAPEGQANWEAPTIRLRRAELLDRCPENWLLVIELGSLVGCIGVLGLLLSPRTWRPGIILTTTLLAFCLATASLDAPNYRYRMILEPLMIVGGVVGGAVWRRVIDLGTAAINSEHVP